MASRSVPQKKALPRWKTEKKLASDGHQSTREEDYKAMRYLRILQEGANGVKGILATKDSEGELLIPYAHQRQAVKLCAVAERPFHILAHDAGTGKTATFFQLFSAVELLASGGARCVVVVPPATLSQWKDTAHTWLNLEKKDKVIVCTNKEKHVTSEMLKDVRVLVITRQLLSRLYKTCFEKILDHHRNSSGQMVGGWGRVEGVPLHPLFCVKWDLYGADEAHMNRNPKTEWCASSKQLAKGLMQNGTLVGGCKKTIALTATPIMHGPGDMVGLCMSINASEEFQDIKNWTMHGQGSTINRDTVRRFHQHIDLVKDDILNLPPIIQQTFDFSPKTSIDEAEQYNNYLQNAQNLKVRLEASKGSSQDLHKLMMLLQRMQQMLVSPRLAEPEIGAEFFKKHPQEIETAAQRDMGALEALYDRVHALQDEGHERIIVACCHVVLMRIGMAYLHRRSSAEHSVGEITLYDGSLTLPRRNKLRTKFLETPGRGILFLSIGAGGTGLHLVPKAGVPEARFCRACVFWGSRPFSPQQVKQTMKRIHRIGQKYPVHVQHLIPRGSVDYAINQVHGDKAGLAMAIVEDDWTSCDAGGNWRTRGRIVDNCCILKENGEFSDTGQLPIRPIGRGTVRQMLASEITLGPSVPIQPRGPPIQGTFFRAPEAAGVPQGVIQAGTGLAAPAPVRHARPVGMNALTLSLGGGVKRDRPVAEASDKFRDYKKPRAIGPCAELFRPAAAGGPPPPPPPPPPAYRPRAVPMPSVSVLPFGMATIKTSQALDASGLLAEATRLATSTALRPL